MLVRLRSQGAEPCQQLHYLLMTTEKLAKAYFARNASPPPQHGGFPRFLQTLVHHADQKITPRLFGFPNHQVFRSWVRGGVIVLAHELEQLWPRRNYDGPNPEYPWPHAVPQFVPVTLPFPIWPKLHTPAGRTFLKFIDTAVNEFPKYGTS